MSDHISVNLIPAYKPLICRTRPTTRTVQVWTEEVSSALQDCFECTDWEVFKEGTDLDGYTSSVLSYLTFSSRQVAQCLHRWCMNVDMNVVVVGEAVGAGLAATFPSSVCPRAAVATHVAYHHQL
ncbi:hypothetical protein L3Q82_004542 [Scortum barcoo]|uniref:Uncharacterized protein n=1 Tax=Scortum barcoo TaxID=214431 RepID=A0ACB8VGR7_9TELE|nr:hypothetical protein L3Q82_004542 [Scortum barcoo]